MTIREWAHWFNTPTYMHKFYTARYSASTGNKLTQFIFIGLTCKCCNRWQNCGHGEDCPVGDM